MHKPLDRQNRFDAARKTAGMLELGVCYYPEQWPREKWDEDARRMAGLGLAWVRIGEFAWHATVRNALKSCSPISA